MSENDWAVPDHPETDDEQAWLDWSAALEVNRVLGLRMVSTSEDGAAFVVEQAVMRNSRADIHGGQMLAVADQCAGIAVKRGVPGDKVQCATASLSAQFLRPSGIPLDVDARVTKHGRRLAFVTIDARDPEGVPCFQAQATLSIRHG